MNFTSLNSLVVIYISLRFFVDGLEELLILPTAWYYMRYLNESYTFLGLTVASYSVGTLFFAPFVGALDVKLQRSSKIILVLSGFLKLFGNLLYSIPVNGYFPLFGRFISGLGESAVSVFYGAIAKGSTDENRAKAFLFFEGLYFIGTTFGPAVGALLTFNINIFGWQINEGNSPAVVLTIVWCFLLTLAMFLPSDLMEGSEPDKDMCSEGDTGSSKPVADTNIITCPKRIVFSLYYYVFLFIFFYCVISFYVPLLAVDQLGLGLVHVKLIFLDSCMFGFVAYIFAYLLVERISQKNLLGFGIFSHVIPLTILFYFALFWNRNMPVNAAYLLLVSFVIISVNSINLSFIGSLITKSTPVNSASFYQSITFTILHVGLILGRVTAGVTFSKTLMLYNCFGLTLVWLIGIIWFCIEYRNFPRAAKDEE